jgi:GNAT superfamily N-acetyltransferase
VLGCACITDEPETAYAAVPWAVEGPALVVHRVAVDPTLQRGGVASALLTYAEDWARARGIPVFHADTYCKNRKMQALFRKRGFVQRGEIHLPGRSLPFPAFEKLL